jgi:hypothetical protein
MGHAVAHRLHSGQRCTPLRKGPQSQQQHRCAGSLMAGGDAKLGRFRHWRLSEQQPPKSPTDHEKNDRHEPVGRNRKYGPGLPHPAQVHHSQDSDEAEGDEDGMWFQLEKGGCDGIDAGRYRHGDRQHVVDQQSAGRYQGRRAAEIGSADGVRATTMWIGLAGLPVRNHHHRQQHDHRRRDPRRQEKQRQTTETERAQHLLGGVGVRGQRI